MKNRFAVLGIGSLIDGNLQMLKELLFLGLDAFYYQKISEDYECFQEALQKCFTFADIIVCLGNKDSFHEMNLHLFSLPIFWLPEDFSLCKDLISEKFSIKICKNIALDLQKVLLQERKTLAVAESCTGGYISHLITSHAGCSQYFLGSFITYSNDLKKSLLGVKQETLENCGAVSSQTVQEMAEGVLRQTGADFSIAVSGVAGPEGGTKQNPVGSVWVAVGSKSGSLQSQKFHIQGDRATVISLSSLEAISFLYKIVLN